MIDFLLSDGVFPFAVALGLMFAIAVMEGVGMLLGAGISSLLETIMPDTDIDIDSDVDLEGETAGALSRFLGWLYVGKVPALIILVVFLTAFGLLGIAVQYSVWSSFGFKLPGLLAVILAIPVTLPVVRGIASLLARIMPQDITSAVATDSFIGLTATITIGTAKQDLAAEARIQDSHGTTHYVQVRPDTGEADMPQGSQVLLVRQHGLNFIAIHQ